jgi:thiamine biosynthesis lipoprotein
MPPRLENERGLAALSTCRQSKSTILKLPGVVNKSPTVDSGTVLCYKQGVTVMKRALCFGLALLAAGAAGCRSYNTWRKTTLMYFDTVCELQLYCSAPAFAEARDVIDKEFREVSRLFSPGSRDYAAPRVRALFTQAQGVFLRSRGCFDISVGALSRLWGFHSEDRRLPEPEEIQEALRFVGLDKIGIRPDRLEVPEGMELDWGAIAKGYGIDLAARALIDLGVQRGFINAGGDIFCWGTNPRGQPWQVGIKHPRGGGFLGVLSLTGQGAATTGDYQRFFMQDGVRYHHVFDPRTGRPARGKQSVTVAGPEASLCDALSTALFVSGSPEEIMQGYPEYGAFLVDADGRLTTLGKAFPLRPEPRDGP